MTSKDTLAVQVRQDVIIAAQSVCESRDWETLGVSAISDTQKREIIDQVRLPQDV
jgi:hypothetical protein